MPRGTYSANFKLPLHKRFRVLFFFHSYIFLSATDAQNSLLHPVSNGCSSPVNQQQQHSTNGEQQPSSPLSSEILTEFSRYTASSGASGPRNEVSSPSDSSAAPAGNEASQNNETLDLSRQLSDHLLSSALEVRGGKRRSSDNQGNTQTGVKRSSAAAHFPGMSMGSGGLSFPPMGLNSSSILGNLSQMNHPLLMTGSGGSSFLQPSGQARADLQSIFPSAGSDLLRHSVTGNGQIPTPSSSSLPAVFSSASTTSPMSSSSTAAPSSSLASGSLPPYLMNHNMTSLLSPGFPLNFCQSLLSEPRMFPNPLISGSGGFPVPNSNSTSFLSQFNSPTSSLLGAALSQPDRRLDTENGGSSSDDDVIEVTGQ